MPKVPIMHMVPPWAVDDRIFSDRPFVRGWAHGWAEGVLKGKAHLMLRMLRLRGWTVPAEQEARVLACRDEAQIERWVDRVLTAGTLDEVLV